MQASTRARFVAAPEGRFVRGRTWILGCPIAGVYVNLFAGRPGESDLRELARAYGVKAGVAPHVVLFDGSRVETVDAPAHDLLLRFFTEHADKFTPNLVRAAFVHGEGLPGALFAGYRKLLPLPACETENFTDTDAALRWLDVAAPVRAEIVALAETIGTAAPELVRLAAILDERPDVTLIQAAKALAVAPRTLQRALAQQGTTFRDEVDRARWARASRRVAGSDEPLGALALDLGFATQQAFTDWFRSHAQESPGAFRRRHRR